MVRRIESLEHEPHILIAVEPYPEGLATVQQIAGEGQIACIAPFDSGAKLPAELIADCSVLFTDIPPDNLAEMRHLRWLQLGSAGYEQLYNLPLREMGVRVTNASGVNDVPIAEWCIAMMLLFERDIRGLIDMQQRRSWEREPRYQSELRGRRVGIVGYGNIGREVGRLCRCLGLEVWAVARGPIGPRPQRFAAPGTGDPEGVLAERTFRLAELAEVLPQVDYLILTLPLSPATTALLGERELRLMRRSAVLLNPSRGRLVAEAGLIRALQEGWIAGAALDTHFRYPLPSEHVLWTLPNVVLTPHISGSSGSRHFQSRLWSLFADNLTRYMRGQPLLNELASGDVVPV